MKTNFVLLIWITTGLFPLVTFAQTSDPIQNPALAKINFIRRTGINGFADFYSIFIDGKLVCKLNNDRFSTKMVDTGQHTIVVQMTGEQVDERITIPLKLNLKANETSYIQLDFDDNAAQYKLYCFTISEKTALKLLKNCLKKPQCN